jgi:hypothetical protein
VSRTRFSLDRCLGRRDVHDALRAAGERVEIHDAHFVEDTHDEEWLVKVGAEGWVVLTKDDLRQNPLAIAALVSAGVAAFVFTKRAAAGSQVSAAFVQALPRIRRALAEMALPLVATVAPGGQVTVQWAAGARLPTPVTFR